MSITTFKKYQYIEEYNYSLTTVDIAGHNLTEIGSTSIDVNGSNLWAAGGVAYLGAILLGPIGLIAGGLAYIFGLGEAIARRNKINKIKGSCEENLNNMCKKIRINIESDIDKMVLALGKAAKDNMDITFKKLYLAYDYVDDFFLETGRIEEWIDFLRYEVKLDFNIQVKEMLLGNCK